MRELETRQRHVEALALNTTTATTATRPRPPPPATSPTTTTTTLQRERAGMWANGEWCDSALQVSASTSPGDRPYPAWAANGSV